MKCSDFFSTSTLYRGGVIGGGSDGEVCTTTDITLVGRVSSSGTHRVGAKMAGSSCAVRLADLLDRRGPL